MKRVIRSNIFETNSSSSHSIVKANRNQYFIPNNLSFGTDNKLHITGGEFGWGYNRYCDFHTKLQYAITMVYETEIPFVDASNWDNRNKIIELIKNTKGFTNLDNMIKVEFNCVGIEIEPISSHWYPFGFINHQSCENYSSLEDFLNDYGVSLYDFLFDNNVELIIDNDN